MDVVSSIIIVTILIIIKHYKPLSKSVGLECNIAGRSYPDAG